MGFDTFKKIIDTYNDDFELQIEGGEPLLNKNLYLFIYYAVSTSRCKKIIISTNGKLLKNHLQRLVDFAAYTHVEILIKMSINYYLYNEDPSIIKNARDLYLATEFIEGFNVRFNVRLRNNDEWLRNELVNGKIIDYCNVYYLQSYGRLLNDNNYEKPKIFQNIDDWYIYSSDGQCFDKDLILRSEHEKSVK